MIKPLALLVLLTVVHSGCATVGSGRETVALRLEGNVPDATIWVDDHLVGKLSDFSKSGKRLPVGFHRVEVRATGYYSHFQEVDAHPGQDISIHADLHELIQ